MRDNRIRPIGEEEIMDYRNTQDAYYPTMHLMGDLKEETGKEYEMVSTSSGAMVNGKWTIVGEHEYVAARTDEYGISVSPDSTDPIDIQRNYERTLSATEQRQIQIARMFAVK